MMEERSEDDHGLGNMGRWSAALGLVAIVVVFVAAATVHILSQAIEPLMVAWLGVGVGAVWTISKLLREKCRPLVIDVHSAREVFAAIFGAIVTRLFSQVLGDNVVLASGLVGLIGCLFTHRYRAAVFCGSFAGMTSATVFSMAEMVVAGGLCGVVFVAGKYYLDGFGGRLGTTAFAACATVVGGSSIMLSVNYDVGIGRTSGAVQGLEILVAMGLLCSASAWVTHELSERAEDTVLSAAIVGILSGMVLLLAPNKLNSLLMCVAYVGAFIGMGAKYRLERRLYYIYAGLVGALSLYYTQTLFPGLGGKLGTIALISSLVAYTSISVLAKLGQALAIVRLRFMVRPFQDL